MADKSKYISKGERKNVNPSVSKAVKRDRTPIDYWTTKQKSWAQGQNPWIRVPNSDPMKTNARYVRVRSNTVWGDPRDFVTVLGRAQ
jgi:hypothetical protein